MNVEVFDSTFGAAYLSQKQTKAGFNMKASLCLF
jgi:hypothetical protein